MFAVAVFLSTLLLMGAAPAKADWDAQSSAPAGSIEGYTSEVSVLPGDTVHFHVSTVPAQSYRLQIYRIGWWNGASSPPLLACLPSCRTSKKGVRQPTAPMDTTTGERDAGWPVTNSFTVPSRWSSGYYVAKLVFTSGPNAGTGRLVPFIVREPPTQHAAILVQAATNTWEAYNTWGGKSLYPDASTHGIPANHVSYNRPYLLTGVGGQSLFDWEIQLARFLEREGYSVAYTTDVDVDRDPSSLLGHKLDIVSGHSEYWTMGQVNAWKAARDAGVNEAFIGADTSYWQVRYADDRRTIIGYKDSGTDPIGATDPQLRTIRFADVGLPPCELQGVQYQGGLANSTNAPPYSVAPNADLTGPWFAGTGLVADAVLSSSVLGYEWDGIWPGCNVPPLTQYFHYQGRPGRSDADSVSYTAPSGARVFAAGAVRWSWMLDGYGQAAGSVNPRIQRFTRNLVDDLSGEVGRDFSPRRTAGSSRPTRGRRCVRRSSRPPRRRCSGHGH